MSATTLPPTRIATFINSSPSTVYTTLTTAEGWDAWFTSGTKLVAKKNGRIRFRWRDWGVDHIEGEDGGAVLEADTDRRFVFQWNPHGAGIITVEIDLQPLADGTVVRLTESGYGTDDKSLLAMQDCAAGWGEALTLLKFYLEHGVKYGRVPKERSMNLKNAKVLVTGGSSGIGFATAKELKPRGAAVAICGRDRARLEQAAREIEAVAVHADVSVENDVVPMIARVIEQLGGYDVLVNNAGFGKWAPLLETTLEDMQSVFATNVFGAMMVARESARHFVRQNRGNIINVASTAALRGYAGGTTYSASKFALHGMTECWRAELRKHNIRVMQVNPSEVQTEFFSRSGREQARSERKLRPVEIAHTICAMLEMDDRGFIPELSVWATNPD